jgi:hypothetical protein
VRDIMCALSRESLAQPWWVAEREIKLRSRSKKRVDTKTAHLIMRASSEAKTFFKKLNQVICCGH